ncbi:MAG TPA: hypothetical protein VF412_00120 [Bdellovibrio sp.]|uniref:hypothetical protein n=1 Tax=Bdellovibrio sp. TaxID=28201 RepID=UPI002EDE664B
MDDFTARQIDRMKSLCEMAILRKVDPSKFVRDQWALIDMVKATNESLWEEYRSIVNQVEITIAIALDEKGQLEESDLLSIEQAVGKAKDFIARVQNQH